MLEGFREKKDEVARAIGELAGIARDLGAKSLGDRVERDLVTKLSEDRFHLVVVGEFNHGKSTFVNALLGESVLATGVTPTTAAIHHLKWSRSISSGRARSRWGGEPPRTTWISSRSATRRRSSKSGSSSSTPQG
jgi:hypothetical protein